MSRSEGSKEKKVACVVAWLQREHGATVVPVRGCLVIVQADLVDHIHPGEIKVTTFVATEKEVEKWFDNAARKMLADGLEQDDALAETWPEGAAGAGDPQREEQENAKESHK